MTLVEQIITLHRHLSDGDVAHAFGGALALAWCTERARATIDIDVNLFVEAAAAELALRCLPADIEVAEQDVSIGHEASVSRIGEEQMFYLTSRGLTEAEASTMIVNGFIEPLVKELPMEYAVEMNRLIQLQMEGSVG